MNSDVAIQVNRARQFLRDIRDAVARHPVASKYAEIKLHERREASVSILRMSGSVDGVPVEMHVHVHDDQPLRPHIEYSRWLEYLRSAEAMSVTASAFSAAHDQACRTYYPDSERWQRTVQLAMDQSFAALLRNRLN